MVQRRLPLMVLAAIAAGACGEDPSFLDTRNDRKTSGGSAITDGDAAPSDTPAGSTTGDKEGDDAPPPSGSTMPPSGDATPTLPPEIPSAEGGDLDALHKCLAKWKNHPFKGTVDNYERISASVTVGGFGNAVNDAESTDEPFLVLIDAGVNVLGAPTYNLMNKNGYYCMKVNVNVATSLTVNLHCNARLADQKVNVNVGTTQSDTTSTVGVHVLSNVQVNSVRPEGASCIR